MKDFILYMMLMTAYMLPWHADASSPMQKANTLKMATYNIRNGIGMDGICDYDRIAGAITDISADIVGVQEVDSMTQRSNGRYVLDEIASRCLYHPYFAEAIDYDGGKYGIGILSKEKPISVTRIPLPGNEEARVMIIAEFPEYSFANTHLSLLPEDALASVDIIVNRARESAKPFFIVGDWNSHPDSPTVSRLKEAGFEFISDGKTYTYPASTPEECLDYIAVYAPDAHGVIAMDTRVVNEPLASDHRPVYAEVRFNIPVSNINTERTSPQSEDSTNAGGCTSHLP